MSNYLMFSISFLFSAEQEQQDFITCGDCQHEFKLCDIVKFIQHKVNGCNKENVDPFENNDPGADSSSPHDGTEPVSLIGNRRTSISAPIANRGTPELRDKSSPRPSRELPSTATASGALDGAKSANNSNNNNDDEDDEDSNEEGENVETSSRRKKKCVANSESNGPNQGQLSFIFAPQVIESISSNLV